MLDKVLDKIKEIVRIKKFDNTEILIDNKLPDDIILTLFRMARGKKAP